MPKKLDLHPPENLSKKENVNEFDTSHKRFSIDILKTDPYTLRYKALNEKLSLFQLSYILYHIANHKGTSSIRSFSEDAKVKIKENTETAKHAKKLIETMNAKNYLTFG
ncbi:MAG: hypothetical protein Nk1A_3010 [Endomicrobiia bacterium]|nr:MAG: hypothetical protein Nk1A_3010 [Endomicrobiia bacterium]